MKKCRYHHTVLILLVLQSVPGLICAGDTPTNVALGKTAYIQETNDFYPNPGVAVDGNTDPVFITWSCAQSHYQIQNKPWWKVDLGGNYVIQNVKNLNRVDCCSSRLSNFTVYVGFDNITLSNNMLCHYQASAVGPGSWLDAVCPQLIIGRFVAIQIIGPSSENEEILTLCEVEVYATLLPLSYKGKRKRIAHGQRISNHQINNEVRTSSLGDCVHKCWSSGEKLCVAFSFCIYDGEMWCRLGYTYSSDYLEPHQDCDTYTLTYHV